MNTNVAAAQQAVLTAGCPVFEPGTAEYARGLDRWNSAITNKPALIARPRATDDVRACLTAAVANGVPIAVRGGGQDWVGRGISDGGLTLDLSGMRQVSVDPGARTATIAGGATASDLNAAIGSSGLSAVTGNAGAVGMVGLITGGGYGPLTTRFGLASDNLLDAEVVLADGQVVRANREQNADLFWALRGGGGNFGIVTSIDVRLHDVEIMSGMIIFPWMDAEAIIRGYAEAAAGAPDELSLAVAMSVSPDGAPVVVLAPTWTGDAEEGQRWLARLQAFGTPIMTKFAPMTFGDILAFADGQLPPGRRYEVATRWFDDLSPETIASLLSAFEARTSPLTRIVLNHFHGAGTRAAPTESAFGMRQAHYTALIYAAWEDQAGSDAEHRRWATDLSAQLAGAASPGGYANLLAPQAHDQIADAYGVNGPRLAELKRKFDPTNVFSSALPLPATA